MRERKGKGSLKILLFLAAFWAVGIFLRFVLVGDLTTHDED